MTIPASHRKIAIAANVPESFRVLLRAQLDHLRDHGFEVHCIAGPGPYLDELARDGFPTHEVPLTRLLRPLQDVRAVAALLRLFRRERFALVHTHTPKTALLAQLAARLARVPHIVNTIHGLLGHDMVAMPRRAALAAVDRATCVLASALLSQSAEDVDRAIAQRMCRPRKIRHLGQGIDLARFDPDRIAAATDREALRARLGLPSGALVVAMIARFTREKGYPDFLALARRLAHERADVHFLVVGTSLRERDAVHVDPAAAGLEGRLTILVDRRDMPEIYAAADLVVLPTYREGFPRSLVEASAMGIPAVSTRIRGCREAVADGETGLLVPPGDGEALHGAVAALCADPQRRARMGAAARQRARVQFDERRVCDRVLTLYRELLRPGARAAVRPYALKRVLDVTGALLLLVLAAPFLALAALAIALTMGRPILFRQTRIGLHDRAFTLMKLRTMRPSRGGDGVSARDGERLTTVGGWLRASSLDELPQLWNVLRGDMSLVGPRPLLPCYLPRYSTEQRRRHEALPGITGLAQVKGRNGLSWDEKFAFDVWYVDHRGLRLDLWVLWRTLVAVVRRDGIGARGHATMPEFLGTTSLEGSH